MRISFIGSGRVAHQLAHALAPKHTIVQIYSPNHAQVLAAQVGAKAINDVQDLDAKVDLLIIAVSDQAIAQVAQDIAPYVLDTLCVHTSGSTDLAVLKTLPRHGVFYPLQTFSFESQIDWQTTPFLIEAAHTNDQTLLIDLAQSLSQTVHVYSSDQRQSLHLAAVFACNFSNYCLDVAKQVVDVKNVDFALLHPLILETAHKATLHDPHTVQTGPAKRHDENILQLHQNVLSHLNRSDLEALYGLLSEQIQHRHPQNL